MHCKICAKLSKSFLSNSLFLLFFFVSLVTTSNEASALDGDLHPGKIKAGESELYSLAIDLSLAGKITDNALIDKVNENKEQDFFWHFTPAVRLDLGSRQYHAAFEAQGDITRYQKFDSEEATSSYLWSLIDLNLDNGLGISAMGGSKHIVEKRRDSLQKALIRQRIEYGGGSIKYNNGTGSSVKIDLDVSKYDFNSKWQQYRERDVDHGRVTFYYGDDIPNELHPKNAYFIEFDRYEVEYTLKDVLPIDYSNIINEGFVGYTWFKDYSSYGMVKIGYGKKDFDNETTMELSSHGAVVLEGEIYHAFTRKNTFFKGNALKKIGESEIYGVRYIDHSEAQGEASYGLGGSFAIFAKGKYVRDSFSDAYIFDFQRLDEYGESGGGFTYSPKNWFKIALEHQYNRRESNYDFYDFKENVTTLSFDLTL